MTTLPSLIESGIAEFRKKFCTSPAMGLSQFAQAWKIEAFIASLATKVHNAALDSALEALPPINRIESYADEMTDTEKGWDNYEEQARANLSALKKENV